VRGRKAEDLYGVVKDEEPTGDDGVGLHCDPPVSEHPVSEDDTRSAITQPVCLAVERLDRYLTRRWPIRFQETVSEPTSRLVVLRERRACLVEKETTDDSRCDSAKAGIIDPVARLAPEIDSSRSPLLHAPDGSEKLLSEPARLSPGKPSLSCIPNGRNPGDRLHHVGQ
jgi:hypothetical protein